MLTALLLWGAPFVVQAPAAQEIEFDARSHLAEFEACAGSEFAPLYDLRSFLDRNRQRLEPAQLSELRTRWEEERRRVALEIERIQNVPEEGALWSLRKSLLPHPYLGRIAYTRVDAHAPFYFFVKRPDADEPTYYERVANAYGAWFRELERLFVERYVTPLGLAQRADHRVYATFVLDSSGAYKNYADAVDTTGLYAARAHYDPELGIAVTYENTYQSESRSEHRRAALHELVHALQHAYSSDAKRLPRAVWFNEGLADYLSYCEGLLPPALAERKVDLDALKVMAVMAQVPDAVRSALLPIEELVPLESYEQAIRHMRARAGGFAIQVAGEDIAIPLLYAQSNLWMFFLHQGEQGRHAPALMRYVASALRGDGSLSAFRTAFAGTDLAGLDRAFRKWLNETIGQRLRLSAGLPLEPVRAGDPSPAAPASGSTPAPAPVAATAPFVPAELLPDISDAEIGFALALAEAQRGALAAAEARLRALADTAAEPLRARCTREAERVAEFRALRRRFFEHLTQPSARKLDVELDGQKLVAQVVALEGESLRLGTNKRGLEQLELERLASLPVAELMRDRKYAFEAPWSSAWAFVLAGDERWKKALPANEPAAAALRADAERDYPARLALARAAGELVRLAESPAPADAAAARTTLDALTRLLRDSGGQPLVVAKRPALRALAGTALQQLFDAGGLASCLGGALEELSGGRVRLTYAFDSPAELADFRQTEYLSSHALERARQDFVLANGRLNARGYACMRSRLAFEGEQLVRCRAGFQEPDGSYDPRFLFRLGLNDDGLLSYAASDLSGSLQVIDMPGNFVQQTESGTTSLVLGETYTLELRFDGQSVATSVNGQPRARSSAGPRTTGGVFLFTSADFPLQVEELVLEGKPTPESLLQLRAEWSATRLSELGLD